MDFASWRKCDFQIHTPRDPNWGGNRPIGIGEAVTENGTKATEAEVDAERRQWANEFVDQCVKEGLGAVALTDHHEMVMVPYVQQVIEERQNADPDFDLWLFPGMELSTKGGKQCLIIFDADLPADLRRQTQGMLGINISDSGDKAAKSSKVTQLAYGYPDIAEVLDKLEPLQRRYIILPNVSQGNSHTVLVDGAYSDFKRMPYIGGYLDRGQTIRTLSIKNRKRISGTDKKWSLKEIYPLPTSDSRSADYKDLGQNNAWIKLAEPTAEAIRQAFLGHQSRIRIKQPQVPSLRVVELKFEGSTILQDTCVPLSPELNAAIGGRGSGKSSLLEYLSFGLGRSCNDILREHYSGTQRLQELTKDTLISNLGRVRLTIIQDGATFMVERGPENAYQPQVTYPNGGIQTVPDKELRSLFPAVVYCQGELAEIGKQAGREAQLADLLQFVDPKYKREDNRLSQNIDAAKAAVKTAIRKLTSHWLLQAKLRQLTTNRDSQTQRVQALEGTLPEQPKEDQATIEYFNKANEFDLKRIQASKHSDQILQEIKASAAKLLIKRDLQSEVIGDADMDAIQQAYDVLFGEFRNGIRKLQNDLQAKRDVLTSLENAWAAKFKHAREARDAILEKLNEYKTVTAQIIDLRKEITKITNEIGDVEMELEATDDPAAVLEHAVASLLEINRERTERTQAWASEIEHLSSGKIKAAVDQNVDLSEIVEAINLVASKTGSLEATRQKELEIAIADASVPELIKQLRAECLSLFFWQKIGAASGDEQPKCVGLMKMLGNTDRIRTALVKFIDTTRVEAISTAVPKPRITLSYCDGDRQISFEKASEGQRAAALLFMLLKQPGGPLIIDQPEGDLDNKIITELTEELHSAKQNRQLIFASHNANIVVNGSAELVTYLNIDDSGSREIACAGAIDKPTICEVITSTMEGGEKAFTDRQKKYGY